LRPVPAKEPHPRQDVSYCMRADQDVVVESLWTPWASLVDNQQINSALAQVALLRAGSSIKQRLGLRADPFRFRGAGSGIELQVVGVAGALTLGKVSIQVVPKFVTGPERLAEWDTSTLFLLEALAGKHVISLLAERQRWRSHRVVDLIAYAFADAVERGLLEQPIHVYRQREESDVVLRGRLNISRQLRSFARTPHLLECDVDQLDSENGFNDVLKWAATALAEASVDPALRKRLQVAVDRIPGHAERAGAQRYMRLTPPPQFQAWNDALELARLLANGMTLSKNGGAGAGYSLLFNMERAFERFVEIALAYAVKSVGDDALSSSRQEWVTYGIPLDSDGKTLRCRPDNILRREGRPVMVVDAKYKLLDDELKLVAGQQAANAPASQDVYELLGGMLAHGCDTGLLIYPSNSASADYATRTWSINAFGRQVRIGALSIDLLRLRSRAEVAQLLAKVSAEISSFEKGAAVCASVH
jgi:5-methylcytosine-specific restriction enzyme subunit McrC